MQANVAEKISRTVRLLPVEKQEEVLKFVEGLVPQGRSYLDVIAEIGDRIPDEELAILPTDGAENHDHYLYGAPKK